MSRIRSRSLILLLLVLLGGAFAACGGDDADTPAGGDSSGGSQQVTLRLGYFANVTHAPALVGVQDGTFAKELGDNVKLDVKTFNAGPAAIEALFAGEIDIAYVGPNPAINGYVQSNGEALRIIAGAASGGASLVVRPESGIERPQDFAGKKIATPQLGNTQDVALRAWLAENGLNAKEQGGNVNVIPTENATTLTLFQKGDIDAAWVPEPWATRLILQAGGQRFLDERTIWPDGRFVTTNIIVRTGFLKDHRDVVEAFLRGHVRVIQDIQADPARAKTVTNEAIREATTAALPQEVIDAAWENLDFTYDPIPSSLRKGAEDAEKLGFFGAKKPNLDGIYDLTLLNSVLVSVQLAPVQE
ncbi:MAG: ABC transporter substrate-binding protein [Hyphomicrobiales bacterium]